MAEEPDASVVDPASGELVEVDVREILAIVGALEVEKRHLLARIRTRDEQIEALAVQIGLRDQRIADLERHFDGLPSVE